MSKNPKIEFYKINLHPTPSNDGATFRGVFERVFKQLNEDVEDDIVDDLTDQELLNAFFQYFFNKIDNRYNGSDIRKKAFYSKRENNETSITINSIQSTIKGKISGGFYDTGKKLGDITNPEEEERKLGENKILLDDFYFHLFTPINKNVGILALQSYTKDGISDVFLPFITKLFQIPRYTYNSKYEYFMPKVMQDNFRRNSVIKKFKFYNRVIANEMDDGVIRREEFSIDVKITPLGGGLNLDSFPFWKRVLGEKVFQLPNDNSISLQDFNRTEGYIESNDGINTPTPFSLDATGIEDIKPTIFLRNLIRIDEEGVPDWGDLDTYVTTVLNNMIRPEVYPEDYLNED